MTLSKYENLLLNMSSGLKPKDLEKEEVEILIDNLGEEWFEKLGYNGSYDKPNFN